MRHAGGTLDFQQLARFERINVVGTAGSGKSTFGRELAELLDLPYFEMDRMFWKPDWQESSDEELFREVQEATSRRRWVLDGNYTRTIPVKWKHVQLVIWLDLSFVRTVFRVTKRVINRSFTQQEIWPGTGNRESFANAFLSKDSIIWWSISTYRKNRKKYDAMIVAPEYSHICFVRLDSAKSVALCRQGLRHAVESDPG
jgi:adenylate kinase family enzyme